MAAYSNVQSVTRVTLYDGYFKDDTLTNYFVIGDSYSAGEISENGWRCIKVTDNEYFLVNNLRNVYDGNNPHKGGLKYDSGEEYFSYFTKLFKYSLEDEHFTERFYNVYGEDAESMAEYFGFTIKDSDNSDQCGFSYSYSLREGNGYIRGINGNIYNNLYFNKHKILIECDKHPLTYFKDVDTNLYHYGDNPELYDGVCKNLPVKEYMADKSDIDSLGLFGDRVINTKVIDLTFYLNASFPDTIQYGPSQSDVETLDMIDLPYTVDGQCMVKYIENVIMPYLTQMIPSSSICRVSYRNRPLVTLYIDDFDAVNDDYDSMARRWGFNSFLDCSNQYHTNPERWRCLKYNWFGEKMIYNGQEMYVWEMEDYDIGSVTVGYSDDKKIMLTYDYKDFLGLAPIDKEQLYCLIFSKNGVTEKAAYDSDTYNYLVVDCFES
jgi:hypothetical protein